MKSIRYTPSRTGLVLAGGGGLVALLPAIVAGLAGPLALGVAAAGTLLVSVRRGWRRGVDVGALGLYLNVLFAGMTGAGAVGLVVGTVGSVVAWDSAETSVALRRQLPSATDTGGIELLHTAGTVGVVGVASVVSFGIYLLVALSVPVVVPLVLLVAVLALVAALRR